MTYILSQKPYKGAKNLPCIMINYLEKEIDLSEYEALVFTSKNGVVAVDKIDKSWMDLPSYSIGSGTSKAISELGGKVEFEAKNSYGDKFAEEIKKRLGGKRVLFLRAKVVTSKLNTILKDAGVLLDEVVVYETVCNDCKNLKKPESGSCIVFSSPSTVECFFKCFEWNTSYKAVVIGEVTLKALPKDIPYIMSEKTTISSCIQTCLKS